MQEEAVTREVYKCPTIDIRFSRKCHTIALGIGGSARLPEWGAGADEEILCLRAAHASWYAGNPLRVSKYLAGRRPLAEARAQAASQ